MSANKPKKITCTKCDRYSYQLRRCLDGKIMPPTINGGISAVRVTGTLDYICKHSHLKTKIAEKIAKSHQIIATLS